MAWGQYRTAPGGPGSPSPTGPDVPGSTGPDVPGSTGPVTVRNRSGERTVDPVMTDSGTQHQDYIPPAEGWVRQQLEAMDAAGGDTTAAQVQGRPLVVVTMVGARSGRPRRVPLMRVEHEGSYLAVASKGGSPADPQWVANLRAHPEAVSVLDGTTEVPMTSRELGGHERATWWERAVVAFPSYADYQGKTDRQIPVLLLQPR